MPGMTAFLFVLNLILLFRLAVFFFDDRLSVRESWIGGTLIAGILGTCFEPSLSLAALILGVSATFVASFKGDRKEDSHSRPDRRRRSSPGFLDGIRGTEAGSRHRVFGRY